MRSPITLLTLLVLALLTVSATAWFPINKSDNLICKRKSLDAYQAITAFCNKGPYVSNSTPSYIMHSTRTKTANVQPRPPPPKTPKSAASPKTQRRTLTLIVSQVIPIHILPLPYHTIPYHSLPFLPFRSTHSFANNSLPRSQVQARPARPQGVVFQAVLQYVPQWTQERLEC